MWSINWFADWLICWLIDWLIDWQIDWLIGLLIEWLVDWMIDWLTNWLLIGKLIDWFAKWHSDLLYLKSCGLALITFTNIYYLLVVEKWQADWVMHWLLEKIDSCQQTFVCTEAPLFDVDSMLFSPSSKYLALIGERGIVVLEMPIRSGKFAEYDGGEPSVMCR